MGSVGERIRSLRKALGLTQEQLAHILGIKAPSVVQWESNKTNLSGQNLLKAAKSLGVTPDYILYGSAAVGAKIRALRKERKMTISELAAKMDSDVGNISRLERDLQGYGPKTLAKIAEALRVDVADMFLSEKKQYISGWHELAKTRMKEVGLSQECLAEKLGVTQGAVGHWLNKRREPPLDMMLAILAELDISHISFNVDGSINQIGQCIGSSETSRIPLINYEQAVTWSGLNELQVVGVTITYLSTDIDIGNRAFALLIKGTSMEPEFTEGDLVLIDPDEPLHPGDFVVAKNGEEEATFKKYRPRGYSEDGKEIFELAPLNDDYATMRSDRQPIQIIGTMVEHRRRRRRR